jgi:hypothetical protein
VSQLVVSGLGDSFVQGVCSQLIWYCTVWIQYATGVSEGHIKVRFGLFSLPSLDGSIGDEAGVSAGWLGVNRIHVI